MRRKGKMIAAFLVSFLLVGCSKNSKSETVSPERETQLKEKSVAARQYTEGNIGFLEANDTVYWYDATTCLLNYLDERDMSWHVLCGKPNCSHVVETVGNSMEHTSDCDAFIERMFNTPLGFYDGRIYYVEGAVALPDRWISSVKADGTDHRRETEITFQQGASATQCYFHYGRLYVLDSFVDKDSKLSIYTLDDNKKTTITLNEYVGSLYPSGEFIYYFQINSDDFSNIRLKRMTLDGKTIDDQLNADESNQLSSSIGIYFANDAAYSFRQDKGLYKLDYETGKETILWNDMADYDAPSYYLFSDGQHIYLRASGDEIYFQGDQHTLLIFDMNGNLIKDMDIVNTDEAKKQIRDKMNATEDKELKAQYQNYYNHIVGDGEASGYDAFFGSIKGYLFSGNYAMPNQYLKISDLSSEETALEWTDTTFTN